MALMPRASVPKDLIWNLVVENSEPAVVYSRHDLVRCGGGGNTFISVVNCKGAFPLGGVVKAHHNATVGARLDNRGNNVTVHAYALIRNTACCGTGREYVYGIGQLVKELGLGKDVGESTSEYTKIVNVAATVYSRQVAVLRIKLAVIDRVEAMA